MLGFTQNRQPETRQIICRYPGKLCPKTVSKPSAFKCQGCYWSGKIGIPKIDAQNASCDIDLRMLEQIRPTTVREELYQ